MAKTRVALSKSTTGKVKFYSKSESGKLKGLDKRDVPKYKKEDHKVVQGRPLMKGTTQGKMHKGKVVTVPQKGFDRKATKNIKNVTRGTRGK